MIIKERKKRNNKGFSLVELLVALAVSATVITIVGSFITQGSKFYNKTGNSVNLQNELQEVSNIVCDTLQEATYLEIQKNSSELKVFTGSYTNVNTIDIFDSVKGDKSRSRLIYWDGSNVYVFDKASLNQITDNDKKGYRYSSYVTDISISVSEKCKSNNVDGYRQPLMLDVTITVSNKGTIRSETKNITLRNKITELRIKEEAPGAAPEEYLYRIPEGSTSDVLQKIERVD